MACTYPYSTRTTSSQDVQFQLQNEPWAFQLAENSMRTGGGLETNLAEGVGETHPCCSIFSQLVASMREYYHTSQLALSEPPPHIVCSWPNLYRNEPEDRSPYKSPRKWNEQRQPILSIPERPVHEDAIAWRRNSCRLVAGHRLRWQRTCVVILALETVLKKF